VVANDDEVLAVPTEIIDARHGERNVARVHEPRVRLKLELSAVHARWLRTPYGRAVQVEHAERPEVRKRGCIFVLYSDFSCKKRGGEEGGENGRYHGPVGDGTGEMNREHFSG
jgi:hypothetical protein